MLQEKQESDRKLAIKMQMYEDRLQKEDSQIKLRHQKDDEKLARELQEHYDSAAGRVSSPVTTEGFKTMKKKQKYGCHTLDFD